MAIEDMLCTEQEVAQMVDAFYASVRRDALLGPVFDRHVHDWTAHLARLSDFWSSILRHTARFNGTPMTVHAAMPGLDAPLFQRWLMLFRNTLQALPNRAMADRAWTVAQRIAQSLWFGYQVARDDGAIPQALDLRPVQ